MRAVQNQTCLDTLADCSHNSPLGYLHSRRLVKSLQIIGQLFFIVAWDTKKVREPLSHAIPAD